MLHLWLSKAFEVDPRLGSDPIRNYLELPDSVILSVVTFVEVHPQGQDFDKNLPLIILANRAFVRGDSVSGLGYFRKLDQAIIQRSYGRYEYLEQTFFLNQMKELGVHLAVHGKHQEAVALTERIRSDFQKVYSYIFMAEGVYRQDTSAMAFVYLDSAYSINRKIDFTISPLDNRFNLAYVMAGIGGKEMNSQALDIIRDFSLNAKTGGCMLMTWGVAKEGNYYRAATSIPTTFTEDDDLFTRNLILWEECKRRESKASATAWKAMDKEFIWFFEYIFYQPN
jgi:hypothetical protein